MSGGSRAFARLLAFPVRHLGQTAAVALPKLYEVLRNPEVRVTAAEALDKIGGKQARSVLSERLEVEKDQKVLESIREALQQVGG